MEREDVEKRAEVTFKFFLPDHEDNVYIHVNALSMYMALYEIDQQCRSVLKYQSPSQDLEEFCQNLRREIGSAIDLDRVR